MPVIGRSDVLALAEQAGLTPSASVIAGAICEAESGRNTSAVGLNLDPSGAVQSRDRGLWQINDFWHPDVSDQCAFNATCNARAMARISNGGRTWTPWSTYNSGAYRQFLSAYQGIAGVPGEPTPPQPPDIVGHLVTAIRRGYPFWKAYLETLELTFTSIRNGAFGDHASGTDIGSTIF